MSDDDVRASGGVVWRRCGDGRSVEVLVVHRPRYDDWTLPKGKRDRGESDEACAVREIEEETGLRCTLGEELPSTRYTDQRGRPKVVRYWLAEVAGASGDEATFVPNAEVDEVAWLSVAAATAAMSYDRDRVVLDAAGTLFT